MDSFNQGIRCQDIHSGLRDLDPNSSLLVELTDTRFVGMAATLAGLIRGRDIIQDGRALQRISAEQLDVSPFAFDKVVRILEEAEFVEGVKRDGDKVLQFTESVPYFQDLYSTLGGHWKDSKPTELEQQMVAVIDSLAGAPISRDDLKSRLGVDEKSISLVMEIGENAGLIDLVRVPDGEILYSPFFGFENPDRVRSLVQEHGSEQFTLEVEAVRNHQGLELDVDRHPFLVGAVKSGLVMAPSVQIPNQQQTSFAVIPHIADQTLLKTKKPILEKALAVLACLRCAENYGEYNTLASTALVAVIDKLLDPQRGFLNPNSAHRRQYQLMRNAGLIQFAPDTRPNGNWVTPTFIDTQDNREALKMARDLLTHGDSLESRVDDEAARQALGHGTSFQAPMQTKNRFRRFAGPSPEEYAKDFQRIMGLAVL